MAINKLRKVYIAASISHKELLLDELQKAGIIHFEKNLRKEIEEETKELEIKAQQVELDLTRAEYIIDYLKPYERKKTFQQKLEENGTPVQYDSFVNIKEKCDLLDTYNQCYHLGRNLKKLESEIHELKNEETKLEPYRNIQVSFCDIKDTQNTRMKIGYIGETAFKDFHLAVEDFSKKTDMYLIAKEHNRHDYIFIAYLKEEEAELEKIFMKFNFREDDLKITDTIEKELERIEKRREAIKLEKIDITEKSHLLANYLDRVRLYYDHLLTIREKKKAEEHIYETDSVFMIKGWVRKDEINKLHTIINKHTKCYEVYDMEPDEKEPVPVEMINHPLIQPVEFITKLYGYPNYREYDPTPLYFAFYIFFFAVCLTDAGYGIMLAVAAFTLMKMFKARGDFAQLLKLLMYGGSLTIITGALTCGWFGADEEILPQALVNLRILDPMEQALQFLVISLYLGLIHLSWGYLVGASLLIFKKKTQHIQALQKTAWAVFFAAGTPIIVNGVLLNQPLPDHISGILSNIAAGALILQFVLMGIETFSKMKLSGTAVAKFFSILASVFMAVVGNGLSLVKAIIDFASNVLSYSRLMALGLATGGIAMAVNVLAGVAIDMLSAVEVLGYLAALLILIGGHTFNLAISTLGALVHTARLQYVEFFPLFFEGGGKPFEPLSVKTKFNIISGS